MLRQILQLALVAAVAAVACKKEEAPAPAAAPPSKVTVRAAKPFEVKGEVAGPISKGSAGSFLAHVVTGEGFHVNEDYPLSFKPEGSSEGIVFEQARYDLKDQAEKKPCPNGKDHCELHAKVPFTAQNPGPGKVAGVLAFSVCNPEQCLIEKVAITADVQVQ